MSNHTRDPRRRTATSVAAGLRLWAEGHDTQVRAAVELLIRHGVWLRRMDLHATALHRDPDGTYWIDWTSLRSELDAGRYDHIPARERAVLDLALAMAADRYRLSQMGTGTARLIADAVTGALGLPLPRRTTDRTDPTAPALTPGVTT
jgi:hypothetical protein